MAKPKDPAGELIVFDPLANTDLSIPAEMISAIAMGMEDPWVIADRFGFDGIKWARLEQWKPFLDAVAQRRSEFESTGFSTKLKAALYADMIQDQLIKDALSSDASMSQRLAAYDAFVKVGDLLPQKGATGQGSGGPAAPAFTIQINLAPGAPMPTPHVIEMKTE